MKTLNLSLSPSACKNHCSLIKCNPSRGKGGGVPGGEAGHWVVEALRSPLAGGSISRYSRRLLLLGGEGLLLLLGEEGLVLLLLLGKQGLLLWM